MSVYVWFAVWLFNLQALNSRCILFETGRGETHTEIPASSDGSEGEIAQRGQRRQRYQK